MNAIVREIGGEVAAQLEACTRCGMCAEACPFYQVTGDPHYTPIWKVELLRRAYQQRFTWLGRLKVAAGLDRQISDNDLLAWRDLNFGGCSTCNRCSMTCPMGITLGALLHDMRDALASAGAIPVNLVRVRQTLDQHGNVFGYPAEERAGWVEYMADAPDDLYQRDQAEVVYFPGCVASFSPRAQHVAEAFVRTLSAAQVDFTILGEGEACCGFPLRAAGMHGAADALIQQNVASIQARAAKTVVFTCPACRLMWMDEYRKHLSGVRLMHSAEFLAELVAAGKLKFQPFEHTTTYHDPCDLARSGGVYDPPRQVLQAIPGLRLIEVNERRESGLCCGGGGDMEMVAPDMVKKVANRTVTRLAETGAEILATACPQCTRVLERGLQETGRTMKAMDVAEIVAQAAGLG